MTDEIRKRLDEIEAVLFGRDAYMPTAILAMPNPAQALEREQCLAALRREREDLLRQLPATGEASGMHLVINRTLGTTYVRESEPVYELSQADLDRADPYLRYMHEVGEDWR